MEVQKQENSWACSLSTIAMFSEILSHRNKSNLAGHHLLSAPCHMCVYHTDIKLQNINTQIILIDSSYNDAIINYSHNVP